MILNLFPSASAFRQPPRRFLPPCALLAAALIACSSQVSHAITIGDLIGNDLTANSLPDSLQLSVSSKQDHVQTAASASGTSTPASSVSLNPAVSTNLTGTPPPSGETAGDAARDAVNNTLLQESQLIENEATQRATGNLSLTDGTIVYSGLQDIVIPTNFDGIYLDIDGGNGLDSHPVTSTAEFAGWDLNLFFGGFGIAASPDFQPARGDTGNETAVAMLEFGQTVDSSLFYSTGYTGSSDHLGAPGNFQDGVPGYLGFKFTPNDGGPALYGWMRLTLTVNTPGAIIHEWAWNTTGAPIIVGTTAIPEPDTAIFLTGLLAATMLRRHRDQGLTQATPC